jgi:hypothetical protein
MPSEEATAGWKPRMQMNDMTQAGMGHMEVLRGLLIQQGHCLPGVLTSGSCPSQA